jgi:hypothetical protein
MKFCLTLAAALLFALSAFAQAPLGFSYQAVIRGPSGTLITNKNIAVRISILQGSVTGTAVYVETHTPTTNASGLATFDIGSGVVVSGTLGSLSWSRGPYFLKTEVDPDNTSVPPSYTISGTSKLLSVPYALYAGQAGHYIGELFGGGIIFSLWRDPAGVEHGLIASLSNLGTGIWASPYISNVAIGASYQDGATNTAAIITARGTNTAAGVCATYNGGAYTDWYLPAIWELNQLYMQAMAISIILDNDNDPVTTSLNLPNYWSSTLALPSSSTATVQDAWSQTFRGITGNGAAPGETSSSYQASTNTKGIRAIRRF